MDRTLPPQNISPLIKGARWSLLAVGIIYGAVRHRAVSSKETKRRAELERTRPEREARAKAIKEKADKEQMEELRKQFGAEF